MLGSLAAERKTLADRVESLLERRHFTIKKLIPQQLKLKAKETAHRLAKDVDYGEAGEAAEGRPVAWCDPGPATKAEEKPKKKGKMKIRRR